MATTTNKQDSQSETERLHKLLGDYSSKIAQLEFKNSILQGEVARLNVELVAQKRLRRQVKELYHSVDHLILTTIDRKGYTRKVKQRSLPQLQTNAADSDDKRQLMQILQAYDANAYFRLHSPKTAMKLQYRVASKLYRSSRDTAVKLAVKAYQLKGGRRG